MSARYRWPGLVLPLLVLLAGCVTNGVQTSEQEAVLAGWRSIGIHESWIRTDGALAASQRSTADHNHQRIILENETVVPGENRIELETRRARMGTTSVTIESVSNRAASYFGPVRTDRLEEEQTVFGPLFYVSATPRPGTRCVFAFQRLTPGVGTLPSRAMPIVMYGQNCVEGTDTRVALRPFSEMTVRPAAVVLEPAS